MCDVVCDGVYDDVCYVCDDVCDVICDVVWGVEGGGKVKWLILCCLGVLISDGQTNRRTDERTFAVVESLSRLKTNKNT